MTQGPHCDMNKKGPQYQTLARLWENANACFDAQEWGTAMVDLNAAVTLIEENVLAITLLKRAMTHDRQGNSQAAIQDAFKAIELSPRFTDAYLCAGTLLKSVARFGEAIQIFTKGMDASKQEGASCTMGNEYSQEKGIRLLDQAKRALEWDMDVNNSHLFNKLPLELTNDIFTNLISFDDRVQCMYTCRTWQNFLLNEVPRMSRHLVLGNMPMSVMKRLVDAHSFNHGDSDGQGDTKGYNRVSILPSTSYHSIHNALSLLNNPHLRIKTFDILIEVDIYVPLIKEAFIQALQGNSSTLRKLTICGSTNTQNTVEVMTHCPNLSHFTIVANPILLKEAIPSYRALFHEKKTASTPDSRDHNQSRIRYANFQQRRRLIEQQQTLQVERMLRMNNALPDDIPRLGPINVYLQTQAQEATDTMGSSDNNYHYSLRRLELVGTDMMAFITPTFWARVPNLEHLAISESSGPFRTCMIVADFLNKTCRHLKTFRYGVGWYASHEEKEDDHRDGKHQGKMQQCLRDIVIRPTRDTELLSGFGLGVIPTLISSTSCEFLQVLVLQMEVLTQAGFENLVDLPCPRLRQLELHHRHRAVNSGLSIKENHISALVRNCPTLERLVFSRTNISAAALFQLKEACQLRSLCILQNFVSTPLDFTAQHTNGFPFEQQLQMLRQRVRQHQHVAQNTASNQPPFYAHAAPAPRPPTDVADNATGTVNQPPFYAIPPPAPRPSNIHPIARIMTQPPVYAHPAPRPMQPTMQNDTVGGGTMATTAAGNNVDWQVFPQDNVSRRVGWRRNTDRNYEITEQSGINDYYRQLRETVLQARNATALRATMGNGNNPRYLAIAAAASASLTDNLPTAIGVSDEDIISGIRTNTTTSMFNKFVNHISTLTELCISGAYFTDADLSAVIANNHQLRSIKLIRCYALTSNGIVDAFSSLPSSSSALASSSSSSSAAAAAAAASSSTNGSIGRCNSGNGNNTSELFPVAAQQLRHISLVFMQNLDENVIINLSKIPNLEELLIAECIPLKYNTVRSTFDYIQQCRYFLMQPTDATSTGNNSTLKTPSNILRTYFIPDINNARFTDAKDTYRIDCIPGQPSVKTKMIDGADIVKPMMEYI